MTYLDTNDYDHVLVHGTVPIGNVSFCVSVNITDDEALEGDQIYFMILISDDPGVLLGNSVTVITIVDNDSEFKKLAM